MYFQPPYITTIIILFIEQIYYLRPKLRKFFEMDALSSTRDYLDARGPEFQAVIIVDYDNGRLYPLTENTPKCLLPIANRKLLAYQLDMLTKNNISGNNNLVYTIHA